MHIEYQITEDDFVAAANLAMRKRTWWFGLFLYLVIFGAILIIVASAIAVISGVSWTSVISFFLLGVLWLSIPTVIYPLTFRRSFRKTPLLHGTRPSISIKRYSALQAQRQTAG